MNLSKKLKITMIEKAVSCKQLANIIGVDECTIAAWRNMRTSQKKIARFNADKLVWWSDGEITLEDCGY